MAISNIHETLLMYTKQKALINDKLSTNMMNTLSASKQTAENQAKYNDQMDDIYYNYYEDDPETYELLTEQLEQEHELELANLNSWEQELELEKNNLETQLNEINTFESTWTKLLQTNIKSDFSYGGVQQ
ncbi:unknown [Clostridium sp. CAG:768]|jgi:predicted hydrolase (HD superfamily)|nr:unknown [Clostridium sp. CAG:768]